MKYALVAAYLRLRLSATCVGLMARDEAASVASVATLLILPSSARSLWKLAISWVRLPAVLPKAKMLETAASARAPSVPAAISSVPKAEPIAPLRIPSAVSTSPSACVRAALKLRPDCVISTWMR